MCYKKDTTEVFLIKRALPLSLSLLKRRFTTDTPPLEEGGSPLRLPLEMEAFEGLPLNKEAPLSLPPLEKGAGGI
jgi:hypothetical protein